MCKIMISKNVFLEAGFPACSSRQYHAVVVALNPKISAKFEFFAFLEFVRDDQDKLKIN